MPASENVGDKDVAGAIEDVLKQRIGADRHEWWFSQDVQLVNNKDSLLVLTTNRFMVDRVRRSLLEDLKHAACEVFGKPTPVNIRARSVEGACTTLGHSVEGRGSSSDTVPSGHQQPISTGARSTSRASQQKTYQPSLAGLEDHEFEPKTGADKFGSPGRQSRRSSRSVRVVREEPEKLVDLTGAAIAKVPPRGATRRSSGPSAQASGGGVGSNNAFSNAAIDRNNSSTPPTSDAKQVRSLLASTSLSNFCVGSCNTLAHVAAKMVIEQPGTPSPLFFWGPAGTGKTHLLAAIRNELRNRHRLRRVVMLSAEQFTNDFTGAVRGGGLPAFRSRYRDVDALLVDDVQFVGGKKATLRELLYTVDSLLRGRCQLAFTADRPPLELDGLNEELAGRMAGGMVCPLRPLDRETRLNVLRGLAGVTATDVNDEAMERMADELAGDGRVISGAFNHLRTLGAMLGRPATWDELLTSAPDLIAAGRPAVNLGDIQKAVCDMFGLPTGSLSSRGQHRSLSQPRMLAMYLARQYTRAAYSEIGQFFGDRSHSTVIAATKRVEDWISDNKPLRRGSQDLAPRQAIEAIENLLRTG